MPRDVRSAYMMYWYMNALNKVQHLCNEVYVRRTEMYISDLNGVQNLCPLMYVRRTLWYINELNKKIKNAHCQNI